MAPQPKPLTTEQMQTAAQVIYGALYGVCQGRDDQAVTILTMVTATTLHHSAAAAGVDRGGLADHFFDNLADQFNQIDRRG